MKAEVEQFLVDLLEKPNRAEALPWLKESSEASYRTVGELKSNDESLALVNDALMAGAVEVVAVEICTYPDGSQNTGKLVIKLPDYPATRKQVLEWANQFSAALGLESENDFGQRHTLVMLD